MNYNIDFAKEYFVEKYHAKIDTSEYVKYVDDVDSVLFSLLFDDIEVMYHLISENNLLAYPPEMRAEIRRTHIIPYQDHFYLIFYVEDGKTECKIVNGMASNIYEDVRYISEKIDTLL